jgi:multidrug resistance efflux pump
MSDFKRRKATAKPQERTDPLDTEVRCGGRPSDATAAAELDGAGRVAHLVRVFESGHGSITGRPEQDRPEQDLSSTENWRRLYTPTRDDPHLLPQAPPPVDTHVVPPPAVRAGWVSPMVWRVVKTALGLGVVVVVGYGPLQRLLQTSSVEAVVNARMVTLRAPIDGEVQAGPNPLEFGTSLARGEVLFRVTNRRADRSRLDDLSRQVGQLREERPGIAARLADANLLLKDLKEQTRIFAESRILQLEARQGELIADVDAAKAKTEAATIALERHTKLAGNGVLSMSQLTQAQREASVAEKLEAAAHKRLEALGVELEAAQRGVFVGDSYNDRPRSSQRADELAQLVSNLTESLAETDARIARLTVEMAHEKARYDDLATADIVAPAKGSVWEILTAPEEQVHRGQDLVRVLDCGGAVVTAVVSEAVYNRLQVGSAARFLPRDGRESFPGRVVRLTGISASPANLAIQPSMLLRESYHVTVAVPKLADGQDCMVGRTGRVIFDDIPVKAAGPDAP